MRRLSRLLAPDTLTGQAVEIGAGVATVALWLVLALWIDEGAAPPISVPSATTIAGLSPSGETSVGKPGDDPRRGVDHARPAHANRGPP